MRLVAVLLALLAALPACQDGATYKGESAEYWVDQLSDGNIEAWKAIQEIGAPCIPFLLERLADRSESAPTRETAARLLSNFPEQADRITPALALATNDEDKAVARTAFGSLGAYFHADTAAMTTVLKAYDSKNPRGRSGALVAFSGVPKPTADVIDRCVRALDDQDGGVREDAFRVLDHLWLERGVPFDTGRSVLSHIRPKVRILGCRVAARGSFATPDLLACLDDTNEDVRLAALNAIEALGDASSGVTKRLLAMLDDFRSNTGQQAAWTMIALHTHVDRAVEFLGTAGHAVTVAARLGPQAKAVVPFLRRGLRAPKSDKDVGDYAWALYVVTGDPEQPLRALRTEMRSPSWYRKLRACIYAARFGPAATPLVPELRRLLDDDWHGVRRYAATALGYVGPAAKPAIPKLKKLLDDNESKELSAVYHVCRHAAAALACLDVDTPKVKALLTKVIDEYDDNDGNTRPGALRYFWKRGLMPVDKVVHRCIGSLDPPNWDDVPPIIRLLGEIGPAADHAIPALEKLTDKRYEIRDATRKALGLIRRS